MSLSAATQGWKRDSGDVTVTDELFPTARSRKGVALSSITCLLVVPLGSNREYPRVILMVLIKWVTYNQK